MTIPAQPLYLGARYVQMKFYAAPRSPGDPSTIIGTLTLMPDEDVLVLDALKGDKGDQGDPAPFWQPQWDSTITNVVDLDGLQLGAQDAGQAWYISGYWFVWTGTDWATYLGSIPGPPGPTPVISMTAEQILAPTSGPYGTIEVDEGGTADAPTYHMKIPGIVGPKGDNSRILESLDYFNPPEGILDGQTLVYSPTAGGTGIGGFVPGSPDEFPMSWITFPESVFGPAGTYSSTYQPILTTTIPAQENDYYPSVLGHLQWGRQTFIGIEISSAQLEVWVTILPSGSTASPETGDLIGRALYNPSTLDAITLAHILPHFSDSSNPSRAVAPNSNVGLILSGQAVVLNVILVMIGGFGSYVYSAPGTHLSYQMFPVG